MKQALFIESLDFIINHLDEWNRLEPSDAMLSYIAGLRGPISYYFNKLFEHQSITYNLYVRIRHGYKLNTKADGVLRQVEDCLKIIQPIYQPAHFFESTKNTDSNRLEARASAKRLGNFFNHYTHST